MASEAYHDWSGEAADAQLHVNCCNPSLIRFIGFASNIGPAAAVPAGPAPAPLDEAEAARVIDTPIMVTRVNGGGTVLKNYPLNRFITVPC